MTELLGRPCKALLDSIGYVIAAKRHFRVVPVGYETPEKYRCLVSEFASLAQETILPSLPQVDERRADLLARLQGIPLAHGLLILDGLARTAHLGGSVCEFGVAAGRTSALIGSELLGSSRDLWLFDSFCGLPKPSSKDGLKDDIMRLGSIAAYEGEMSCSVDLVRARLQEIGFPEMRLRIVPGFIEDTIRSQALPIAVSFAFVDFDFYEPIRSALSYLDQVVVPGGIVMVHDYGFFSTGAKTAVDEFTETCGSRYEVKLPTGVLRTMCCLRRHERTDPPE